MSTGIAEPADVAAPARTVFAAVMRWDPPIGCDVEHTGKVVRGTHDAQHSTVVLSEQLDLPLGMLGRAGRKSVQPAVRWGPRRFAAFCEGDPA